MLHRAAADRNCIGQYFIAQAREAMQKRERAPPDRDLRLVRRGIGALRRLLDAVGWVQDYAFANRGEMLK